MADLLLFCKQERLYHPPNRIVYWFWTGTEKMERDPSETTLNTTRREMRRRER
jgi:hypothetical protein